MTNINATNINVVSKSNQTEISGVDKQIDFDKIRTFLKNQMENQDLKAPETDIASCALLIIYFQSMRDFLNRQLNSK